MARPFARGSAYDFPVCNVPDLFSRRHGYLNHGISFRTPSGLSCGSSTVNLAKGLEINNSSFSHPSFRPSPANPQSQNPERGPTTIAVLLNRIDQIWPKSVREFQRIIPFQTLTGGTSFIPVVSGDIPGGPISSVLSFPTVLSLLRFPCTAGSSF